MDYHLEEVSGIGKATAERLKAVGIDSVQKLATLDPEDLVKLKIKGIGKETAKKYIISAKKLWNEIVKNSLQEATQKEELAKPKPISKGERMEEKKPLEKTTNIKDLIKTQAECNIGLVGHVDHGMIMSLRHFP